MKIQIAKNCKFILFLLILFNFNILFFAEDSIKIPLEFENHFIHNFTQAVKVSYPQNFVKYGFDAESGKRTSIFVSSPILECTLNKVF